MVASVGAEDIMSLLGLGLSNLRLTSNLLGQDYQRLFPRITAAELYDIKQRCPFLPIDFNPVNPVGLTPRQHAEWTQRLFWGTRRVKMRDEQRNVCWLERASEGWLNELPQEVAHLDEEQLFEVLCVTAELARSSSPLAGQARAAMSVSCEALCAARIGYTHAQVEARLGQILGEPDFHLEITHAD
jgi:hypothetical protein